jgi:hypothetical protein
LLLRGVIAQLVAFGLGQDAEESGIAVRDPMAEGKAADEDGDTCEDGIEEIEGPNRSDTHEVEQCTFYTQIRKRFVEALEDSICAMLRLWFVGHKLLVAGAG